MSTTLSLDAALSGLRAAQRQLDTISNNISNASTAGYTRKILPTETLVVGGVGMGVQLNAIMRSVDKSLIRDTMRQVSVSGGTAVTDAFLTRIQAFHGPSEAETSISARIGKLRSSFSDLSSSPDSITLLNNTLTEAKQVATTFNKYSQMILDMRNETEDKIDDAVALVNAQLENIAQLNRQIQVLTGQGNSTADLEDKRDMALRTVSQYIEVTTFTDNTNKLTVMTQQGQILADGNARQLFFANGNLGHGSSYPASASGLYIGSLTGAEVTQGRIGGEMGALFELRDETLPTYQAQMDEMAQKLAYRLEQQGLRLFTDANGAVPPNVADPGLTGYDGFAAEIRVNALVEADPALLRSGTYGAIIPAGSNEVIRRVYEFGFGPYEYQEASGTVDISAGTLFATLGLTQINRINGNIDLTDYNPDLDAAPNITAPANFTIDVGGGAQNILISPGDTATDLVNNINAACGPGTASLSSSGLLVLNASADITIADVDIGAAGMADLGFAFGTYPASDPSFSVQVGSQSTVTVSIDSLDTAADLLATLNAIPNLSATLGTGGELVLTPTRGGDITLLDVTGTPLAAMGVTVANIAHVPFRQNNLGPAGTLSTGLIAIGSIEDFARATVTKQAQEAAAASNVATQETAFLQTLDQRFADESGVDLDEEVAELVRVQTAYAAAARMISASERMLDELLNAV